MRAQLVVRPQVFTVGSIAEVQGEGVTSGAAPDQVKSRLILSKPAEW